MNKTIGAILLFLMIGTALCARDLTLDLAKELALKNYPAYLAAQEELKAAKSGRLNAYSGLLPSANLQASQTRYEPGQVIGANTAEKLNTYGFSVTQPIFNGGKIWFSARMQEDAVKIARETLRMTKYETLAGVEEQYFSVLENKQLLTIAEMALQSSKTNLEVAQAKYDAGLITRGEYLQIQSEKTSKFVSVLQIKNLYQTSIMGLINYLQIGLIENIAPVDTMSYKSLLEKIQHLSLDQIDVISELCVQYGLEHNPALKIADISVNTSKKTLLMAGGNFLPSINLSFTKNWSKYNFSSDYTDNQTITLAASLPIFPIVDNVTNYTQKNHELKKVKFQYQDSQDAIITGIKSQFLNLVSAAHSIIASRESRTQAKETYEQVQEFFAQGLSSSNELLAAQTMYLAAQNQQVQSLYDFLRARSALQQLLGSEEDILTQLIEMKR
ncbi:MAG TPA: TolC family protein [Candidatus Cloacimonetes bacterium]|nr:TolC family protein [Candidatus Cloacimonadota bacterium]